MVTRPPAGTIPDAPGSYQFKDRDGRVIYVGKAKSLRQRLSNYFQDPKPLPPRTAQMVATAETVEWIQVRNEVEALMLEYTLIKRHQPRFNVRLRDDKSYPFLAVTLDDEWPRPMVMRGRKRKGVRYFGPYGHAYAIRETLDLLLRTFPVRTCSDNKLAAHAAQGRPCLLLPHREVRRTVRRRDRQAGLPTSWCELLEFLDGETDAIVGRLEDRDGEAAATRWSSSGRPASAIGSRRPARRSRAADGRRAQRGPRRHRRRRRRARGGGAGLLRAQGPRGRAQGLRARQGRGAVAAGGPARSPPRGAATATSRRSACPSRCSCRPCPTTRNLRGWLHPLPRLPASRSACRSGAPSAPCKRRSPATPSRSSSAIGCARDGPQQPQPSAQRAAGATRAAGGAAAHRVLRHEPPPGHRLRGLDGGARGRAAEEVASTAGSRSRASPATTTSRRWRRCSRVGYRVPRRP